MQLISEDEAKNYYFLLCKELLSLVPLNIPGNYSGGEAPALNDPAKSSVSRVLAAEMGNLQMGNFLERSQG